MKTGWEGARASSTKHEKKRRKKIRTLGKMIKKNRLITSLFVFTSLAVFVSLNLIFKLQFLPGQENDGYVKIAIWTPLAFKKFYVLPNRFETDSFLGCSSKCEVSHDLADAEDADILILYFQTWNGQENRRMPEFNRSDTQIWFLYEVESPIHLYSWEWHYSAISQRYLRRWNGLFNGTVTYRLDSTIPIPYGRFIERDVPDFSRNYDRLGNKSALAVIMNWYCMNRNSYRDEYATQVDAAGLTVEQLGDCNYPVTKSPFHGDKDCIRTLYYDTTNFDACIKKMSSRYTFYFAFENSLCRDYVSEKFYRAASAELIPVVMNGANMSLFAPPRSYIDVRDFSSPKHLAQYLKKVASDRKLFNSYFWWKPFYDTLTLEGQAYEFELCNVCARSKELVKNARLGKRTVIEDIEDWWVRQGNCHEGTWYPVAGKQ